jgi:hypothetical protein
MAYGLTIDSFQTASDAKTPAGGSFEGELTRAHTRFPKKTANAGLKANQAKRSPARMD